MTEAELSAALADGKSADADVLLGATKTLVSLWIDRGVLDWFRASGAGGQSRINEPLRKAVD